MHEMGRKSKFSEAQIIDAVRDVEGGAKAADVGRRLGVSLPTVNRCTKQYSGMTVKEAKEKNRLEDESARLRQLVAQYGLDNAALKAALAKEW